MYFRQDQASGAVERSRASLTKHLSGEVCPEAVPLGGFEQKTRRTAEEIVKDDDIVSVCGTKSARSG